MLLLSCAPKTVAPPSAFAPMPEPLSNNAVAVLEQDGRSTLYSFYGIGPGKSFKDISRAAYAYDIAANRWRSLSPPPVSEGRLASVAVGLGGRIWLFGGYTVAPDGEEVSTPEVLAYDPSTDRWQRRADMPLPVDDAVALAYADRYIYLVSGWHNDGNAADVQVYDSASDVWFAASSFPGMPVFGHSGGIVGNRIVIIDGVAVLGMKEGRRQFGLVSQAWHGEINPDDPSAIIWRKITHHGGPPLYRAAGGGGADHGLALFAGGSTRAYNYDGIGYDGLPSEPVSGVFGYDPVNDVWMRFADKKRASMDHRGLPYAAGAYWTIGGMATDQTVTPWLDRIEISE